MLIAVAVVSLRESRLSSIRAQVIAEALEAEKSGDVDQSIRNLSRFLDTSPDDLPALEVLARIMAKSPRSVDEAMAAAGVNDQLLRMDPEGAGRQETRRRLVELYVYCGDAHRASSIYRLMPSVATHDLKYRAAQLIARDLIKRAGEKAGPGDHRLLAMALEGVAVPGDRDSLEKSIDEYEKALKGDPADIESAERLARLLQERMNDPARAERVLDALIRAAPGSSAARLVRHRYFSKIRRNDLAAIELEKATELAKDDLEVRLTAAHDALRRGDPAAARRHLAEIPESMRSDLRVRAMRGMIEFSEERPDEAIDSWRQGLLMIGGTDADLTWWLAHALLQMGRIVEARPLVAQYHRLSGEETQPLDRFLQAELDEKTSRPARAILGLEWTKDHIGEYWKPMVQIALGRCYEALGDVPKALAAYHRAIQLDPQMIEGRIAVSRLLARKPDEAAQEIERGLTQVPDEPTLLIALAAGRLQQQSARPAERRDWGDFDRALDRALKVSPANSALLLMRADRLSLSGDLPGAIALLEKSASGAPRNASLWTAWAEGLTRAGRTAEALKVLDLAAAPGAVGDHASIRIARAKVLLALGRGREAREALIRGEKDLTLADRPPLWEAVGRLDFARGDYRSAQASFTEWARLLPDDPRPRLALLDLAQSVGDESAVRSIIETLQALGGPEDIAWRLCRAQELLWTLNSSGQPTHHRDSRLLEASRIVESVLVDAPEVPAAHLLKGDVLKRLNKLDEAIASYRRAWDRGASVALPKLVEMLIRRRKFDELNGLRLKVESFDLDRLSTVASLRIGDVEAADRFIRQAVEDARSSPGTLAWQSRMLESIGKADEAEAALRAAVERKPAEVEPWLELIRSQAKHGKFIEASATIERAKGLIKGVDPGVLEARLRWAAGDRPAADRAFEAALARRPDDAGLRILASHYYEETGRPAEAAASLRDTLRIDPKNRGAARALAVVLAADPATWTGAVEMFGTQARADDAVEDRRARAMVMSMAPDAARRGQAMVSYKDLAEDLPADNVVANTARIRLSELLLEAGQPEKAAEVAGVTATSSTDAATIALYIETLLQSKKWPEALRQLDRLATIKPGDPGEAALRARWIRAAPSRPDEVAAALEEAARDRAGRPGRPRRFGRRRGLNGSVDHDDLPALDRADRVGRAAASRRTHASWMPAQVLAIRGDAPGALALCRPSIYSPALEDRWGAAKVAMTVATQNESNAPLLAQVQEVMDDVSKRDPKSYSLDMLSAILRHLQGRYEDEAGLYREALALLPGDPMATNNLAWVLSEGMNRPDEALALIDGLIARIGRKPEPLDTRGVILSPAWAEASTEAIKRPLEEAGPSRGRLRRRTSSTWRPGVCTEGRAETQEFRPGAATWPGRSGLSPTGTWTPTDRPGRDRLDPGGSEPRSKDPATSPPTRADRWRPGCVPNGTTTLGALISPRRHGS